MTNEELFHHHQEHTDSAEQEVVSETTENTDQYSPSALLRKLQTNVLKSQPLLDTDDEDTTTDILVGNETEEQQDLVVLNLDPADPLGSPQSTCHSTTDTLTTIERHTEV